MLPEFSGPFALARTAGIVTLGGLPVRAWFEANDVLPVQATYRGHKDGRACMCLLTALAYVKLGGDWDALHTRMNLIGLCRGEEPDPNYRRMDQILADVIGIGRRDARDLESGWTDGRVDRAVREARGESTELWDLGFDAWEAAKGAHGGPTGNGVAA